MRLDPSVTESPTLAWAEKVRQLRKAGRPILSLGLGEPDYDTPPHIVEAAHRAMKEGFTRYSAAPGLDELRAAVADKLRRENRVAAKAEEVVITPGAKNALFVAAAALLEPGDEAITLSPGYVSNIPILKLAEPACRLVDVSLPGPAFSLDRDRLAAAVSERTRLLLINYPNNPTGRMLSRGESEFLVELLRRRPRLHLLSDEVYESLALGELKPFSPASVPEIAERVVTVNGFSKSHAMTGWRIGYAHAARPLARHLDQIHRQLNTNTATFTQKAALAALQGPQEHRALFVERLRACKALYQKFLEQRPELRGSVPEGGFFAFVDVSAAKMGSDAFCAALLEETGVALLPGVSFGPAFDGYCRLSLAVPAADFAEALRRLGEFVARRA